VNKKSDDLRETHRARSLVCLPRVARTEAPIFSLKFSDFFSVNLGRAEHERRWDLGSNGIIVSA
jgi:hypothetical protein